MTTKIELKPEDVQAEGYHQALLNFACAKRVNHNMPIYNAVKKMIEAGIDEFSQEVVDLRATMISNEEWFNGLSEIEQFAVVSGHFNQQVENGGWVQWVDNGYAKDELKILIKFIKTLPDSFEVSLIEDLLMKINRNSDRLEWYDGDENERNINVLIRKADKEHTFDETYYMVNKCFLEQCDEFFENQLN